MKKRRKIFFALITLILVSGIAAIGLYSLGDRILDSAFDSYVENVEIALEQTLEVQTPSGSTSTPSSKVVESKPNAGKNATVQQSTNTKEQQQTTPIPMTKSKPQTDNQFPTTQQPTSSSSDDMKITKDKIEDIKAAVTPSDKVEAATLVLSKLSQSDINRLTKLAAGGITPEEKEEIKAIVYSRFTQEEVERIRAMYIKYMNR